LIFRKKKYHLNPVSLVFEEIKISNKRYTWNFIIYTTIILAVTLTSGYLLCYFFGSREARLLEKQVSVLNKEMLVLFNKTRQVSSSLRHDLFPKDNHYRTILQIDTLSSSFRQAGSGGSAAADGLSLNYDLTHQVSIYINKLNQQLEIQTGSYDIIYEKALEYSKQQTHLPAIQPVSQNDLIMISSHFGVRSDPFLFLDQVHCGLDFVAPVGKKVFATGDGIVTFVQYSRTGYGNEIVIDHKFGFGSRYAHLDQIIVKPGEVVKRGQVIGTVGQTGRATGPHLHYEVIYDHKPVNPSFYFDSDLTRQEYAQIINKVNQVTN